MAAGLGLLLLSAAAQAAPDWKIVELRKQLSALSGSLQNDAAERSKSVRELVRELDWSGPPAAAHSAAEFQEPASPADIGWTDIRFALATLSQVYGGKDNYDVMRAGLRNDMEALSVHSGVATLRQLRKRLTNRHLGREIDTQADLLRVPVVIGREATLRLGPDDVLHLSRSDGAFIVNFGRLEVFGGEISATETASRHNDDFVPFVTSVGSGSVHLSGATINRLGFGNTAKFAGLSVMAYPTMRPSQRTVIENTRFDGLVTVAMVGVVNAELRDNRFFDMRRNPLLISRAPGALISGNLFSGSSPTNAIRVSNGSDGTALVGNIVLEGSRAGLLIASGSDNVEISGNLIWRRNGGGVKLQGVNCGRVDHNIILDDRQKGVEVRSSSDALVHANKIVGNKSAGVLVAGQKQGSVTYVTDNLLRENGSGLATAAGAGIALRGNDLSNQMPRLLDGDITQQFRTIIHDLRGEAPILLDSGGARPADQLAPADCAL